MTAEQFAYWLQGYAELTNEAPTAEQWQSIREHLALVFTKVTPPVQFPGIVKEGPNQWIKPVTPTPPFKPLTATCIAPADVNARVTC